MIRCRLGIHAFRFPAHEGPSWSLWDDYDVECSRGCGARRTLRCHRDTHWEQKHDLIPEEPHP